MNLTQEEKDVILVVQLFTKAVDLGYVEGSLGYALGKEVPQVSGIVNQSRIAAILEAFDEEGIQSPESIIAVSKCLYALQLISVEHENN